MKIRKFLSLMLACCMFMGLLLPVSAAEHVNVDYGVDGSLTAEQVYIEPVQIDENTYHYYDENGELLAMYIADAHDVYPASTNATVYNINWTIPGGGIKYSNVDLDTTQGATNVYYRVYFTTGVLTYVGNYFSYADRYYWYNPPKTESFTGYYVCATSHPINFALKNDGHFTTQYTGGFSLSPM